MVDPTAMPKASPKWGGDPDDFPDAERDNMQAVIDTQARAIGAQASLIRYYQELLGLQGTPSTQ